MFFEIGTTNTGISNKLDSGFHRNDALEIFPTLSENCNEGLIIENGRTPMSHANLQEVNHGVVSDP